MHIVTPTHGKEWEALLERNWGGLKAWNDDDVGMNDEMVIYIRDL
jgi:hypothetical protein